MQVKSPTRQALMTPRRRGIVVKSQVLVILLCCLATTTSIWSIIFSFSSVPSNTKASVVQKRPMLLRPTKLAESGIKATCKPAESRSESDVNYYGSTQEKTRVKNDTIPLDLHLNEYYNARAFSLNFVPYCDDISYLVKHQDPNSSPVLFEERHDQYTLVTSGHKISRLGNNAANLTAAEHKENTATALQYVGDELDALGIPYMLFFGTLLGAYRHHDFIPWDDDADVIMLSRHVAELRSILLQRAKDDIATRQAQQDQYVPPNQYQWIVRTGTDSNALPIKIANLANGRYVDIFSVHPTLGGMLTVARSKLFGSYPIGDVFPTQPCLFGEHIYQCPNNPKAILMRKYKNIGVQKEHKKHMKGLPEYSGIVATLAEADFGRVGTSVSSNTSKR